MKNKEPMEEIIREFYRKVFDGRDAEAAREYLTEDYIQHNKGVETGREGFISTFGEAFRAGKKMDLKILHIIQKKDIVSVCLDTGVNMVTDFYRVNDQGMLCEHWDIFIPYGKEVGK